MPQQRQYGACDGVCVIRQPAGGNYKKKLTLPPTPGWVGYLIAYGSPWTYSKHFADICPRREKGQRVFKKQGIGSWHLTVAGIQSFQSLPMPSGPTLKLPLPTHSKPPLPT